MRSCVRGAWGAGRCRMFAAVATAVVASAAISACGSSKSSSHTTTTTTASLSSANLSAALSYTGGKTGAANQSLSPVSVGWISDQTALTGTGHEGNNVAAQAAATLINKNLGGIQGHPLNLVSCFIKTSDADGATCAQQMLSNPAVKVVVTGELLTGEASFVNTIAGKKPILGVFTNGPGLTAKNAFYVSAGIQGQIAAVPYLAQMVKAKTVAVLGPNLPGVSTALGMFKLLFGKLGVNAKLVLYPAAATDLTGPIAASGATAAQGVFLVSSTVPECIAVAKAFTQLGVKGTVVSLPICLNNSVKAAIGDYPKWTYDFTSLNPLAPYAPNSDTASFVAAMNAYGSPSLLTSGLAPLSFGAVLTAARWIDELGVNGYTSPAISAKAKAFTGPMFMGDPNIKFGVPPYPTLGSTRAIFYAYDGNGKFTPTTGGKFICAPIPTCTTP